MESERVVKGPIELVKSEMMDAATWMKIELARAERN